MDFSNSVILPREDFVELQEAAWNQPPMTAKDRVGSMATTLMVSTTVTAAFVIGSWGWAKAMDWKERRDYARKHPVTKTEENVNTK